MSAKKTLFMMMSSVSLFSGWSKFGILPAGGGSAGIFQIAAGIPSGPAGPFVLMIGCWNLWTNERRISSVVHREEFEPEEKNRAL